MLFHSRVESDFEGRRDGFEPGVGGFQFGGGLADCGGGLGTRQLSHDRVAVGLTHVTFGAIEEVLGVEAIGEVVHVDQFALTARWRHLFGCCRSFPAEAGNRWHQEF